MSVNATTSRRDALARRVGKAWNDYEKTEKHGIALGKVCCEYRDAHKSKGGHGSEGRGLVQLLDELSIPKSTAYYWIDRYELSVSKKKNKSARSLSSASVPTVIHAVAPAARDTFIEDTETEALIANAQANPPTILKNGMLVQWNGAVYELGRTAFVTFADQAKEAA